MHDDVTARFDRLEATVAALAAENAELRARLDQTGTATAAPPGDPSTAPPLAQPPGERNPIGRRSVLTKGLAAAGAATAGAIALGSQPAAAVDGQPVLLGRNNSANSSTFINGPARFGVVTTDSVGLIATSTAAEGVGLSAYGEHAQLRLLSRGTDVQPPNDTIAHSTGEMVVDTYGNLWHCNTSGTPGQWRSVSGPGCAGAFFPWTAPIRAYDSRPGTAPANPGPKTRLVANQTRAIRLSTSNAANANTRGVLVQVLLVNAAGNGNFTIWSRGVAKPLANTLVWGGSTGRFSTLAFTTVDADSYVNVSASLATDLVLDVIGVYG